MATKIQQFSETTKQRRGKPSTATSNNYMGNSWQFMFYSKKRPAGLMPAGLDIERMLFTSRIHGR